MRLAAAGRRPGAPSAAVLALSDAAAALIAVGIAYSVRYGLRIPRFITGGEPPDPAHYRSAAPVVAMTVVVVFALMGSYRYRRGVQFVDELFSMLGGLAVSGVVVLAMMGLDREFSYSRVVFAYWLLLCALVISLARYGLRRYQAGRRARGVGAERAVVIGSGAAADLLIQRIRMFPDYGYRLVGVLDDHLPVGGDFGGVKVIGRSRDLRRVAENRRIDVAFIAISDVSQDRILSLVDSCRDLPTDFRIVPSMLDILTTQVTSEQIDGIPLLKLRHGLEIEGSQTLLKRFVDVAVAGLGLVLISPLLGLIALVVRATSPGPVFIHQERVGMGGRLFQAHKFRSMRQDAEADSGPVWAAADDPRRTSVGRFLRRFSADELPQLWNIVVGEMSLVGPRPERPVFVTEFTQRLPRYADRQLVRPGLAGWAQANDLRGQTPVEERLIYDLYYIENWSLAFDLKIILITLFRVWTHKNAY